MASTCVKTGQIAVKEPLHVDTADSTEVAVLGM
jgi:hypothetical protein